MRKRLDESLGRIGGCDRGGLSSEVAINALAKLGRRRHGVDIEQADDTGARADLGKDIVELERLFVNVSELKRLFVNGNDMNRAKVEHRDREVRFAPQTRENAPTRR